MHFEQYGCFSLTRSTLTTDRCYILIKTAPPRREDCSSFIRLQALFSAPSQFHLLLFGEHDAQAFDLTGVDVTLSDRPGQR